MLCHAVVKLELYNLCHSWFTVTYVVFVVCSFVISKYGLKIFAVKNYKLSDCVGPQTPLTQTCAVYRLG